MIRMTFNVYSLIVTYHILERGLRSCDVLYESFTLRATRAKNRFQKKDNDNRTRKYDY